MKKKLLVLIALLVFAVPGVAAANYNYQEKVTICYKDKSFEVKKKYLRFWLEKGAEEGECVPDVCPNIEDNQTTIPEGYVQDAEGLCVPIPEEPTPEPTPEPVVPAVVEAPAPQVIERGK